MGRCRRGGLLGLSGGRVVQEAPGNGGKEKRRNVFGFRRGKSSTNKERKLQSGKGELEPGVFLQNRSVAVFCCLRVIRLKRGYFEKRKGERRLHHKRGEGETGEKLSMNGKRTRGRTSFGVDLCKSGGERIVSQ